jgi:hypothetical protein
MMNTSAGMGSENRDAAGQSLNAHGFFAAWDPNFIHEKKMY